MEEVPKMEKHNLLKKISLGIASLALICPLAMNNLSQPANARRRIRTHRVYRHKNHRRIRKAHKRYHRTNRSYKSGWNDATNDNSVTAISVHNVNFYKYHHNKSYRNGIIAGFKHTLGKRNATRLLRNGNRFAHHHHSSKVCYDGIHHKWLKGF